MYSEDDNTKDDSKSKKLDIADIIKNPNLAKELEQEDLDEIAECVIDGYEEDLESRAEWQETADKIIKLAQLTTEKKDYPFIGASSVKYPLIPTAILQFASKTYPAVVQDGKVVQCSVIGMDPDGSKADMAKRISEHMSYQLLIESSDWEENMDRLLHVYPTVGVAFKKTYFDPIKKCNESLLCMHTDIIVNDNINSLESAPRITHIVKQTTNQIISSIRAGLYMDITLDLISDADKDQTLSERWDNKLEGDEDSSSDYHELLEQHCYYDIDEDDYAEPYIITVHKATKKVLRIVARFDPDSVIYNDKEEITYIKPVHYFTDYHCIPRMDGKYHSLGLGTILLHPNQVINSLTNNIMDAVHLANMQGGIIGNDVDIKGGMQFLQPGEWKRAKNMSAGPLKDSIIPITYNGPSQTAFDLLNFLVESSKELSNTTEMQLGSQSGTNIPASTAQILDNNGQKVFTAMQRRLYRSLKSEYTKLYRLNCLYLPPMTYFRLMDDQHAIKQTDYTAKQVEVKPVADPNLSSMGDKMSKINTVLQLLQQPATASAINVQTLLMMLFKELQIPNPQTLLADPQQAKPSPEEIQAQAQLKMHNDQMQLKMQELQLKAQQVQQQGAQTQANVQKDAAQAQHHVAKAQQIKADTFISVAEMHQENAQHEHQMQLEQNNQDLENKKLDIDREKNHMDHTSDMLDSATKIVKVHKDAEINAKRLDKPSGNKTTS